LFYLSLPHLLLSFLFVTRRPPSFTLFPYTTLFRSLVCGALIGVWTAWTLPLSSTLRRVVQVTLGCALVAAVYMSLMYLEVRRRRSEEHTSELQSRENLVCRLLLEKKKKNI